MSFFSKLLDGGKGEAQDKNEANAGKLWDLFGTESAFGKSQLFKGLAALDTGKTNALANASKYGTQATNQILAGQKQTDAANTASLASKGLLNTTVGANMQAQTQSVTNNSLSTLGEKLGLLNANIETDYAAKKNAGLQTLAQYAMGTVGTASSITPQYQGGQGLAGGIGQGLGTALGAWAGSKFGG